MEISIAADPLYQRLKVLACRNYTGRPPPPQVGPSCDAAGRGSVVLGRNEECCLADETAAQDARKQNCSKYLRATKPNASA
jgi:hypothetical protein